MDFFEHQERARKKTGLLIFYFVLAVLGIILATYLLAIGILYFLDDGTEPKSLQPGWNPGLFLFVALGTSGVILLASLFKTAQLSGGGAVVARELGGRELDLNTTDFHERRLLNVVEEMAIASGVPVPTVYVMDNEDSINAFAAGKTVSDAVVGVTRGCMTLLTRDEIQGVVAHEFSHILNGDMRLNIRLMALLFGILFLALMGELIIRFGVRGGMHSGRKEGAGAALVMLVAGLGLLAIGYVGSFFGNLIKASVSRQREFLADASAVQFTRNPDGLAGALMKIGGLKSGSTVGHPMARDASHLFFGSAFASRHLATHPPLSARIQRLLPHWDGSIPATSTKPVTADSDRARLAATGVRSDAPTAGKAGAAALLAGTYVETPLSESEALESMRGLHPEQIELAHELHENLPPRWIEACHSRSGAQAMIYALLLAQDDALRQSELRQLRETEDTEIHASVPGLFGEVDGLHSTIKFCLIDLCLPTLRHLSQGEYEHFRETTDLLIASDGHVDLFEFALLKVIHRHLDTYFRRTRPPKMRYRNFRQLVEETGVLLSTLAAMSHPDDESAVREAFAHAVGHLEKAAGVEIPFKSADECGLREIDLALRKFDAATPMVKRDLLEASNRSVLTDNAVSSREAELIRAVADAIGCPISPFVRSAPMV